MHGQIDPRGEDLNGEESLGDVLDSVCAAKLIGSHRASKDDRSIQIFDFFIALLTANTEGVCAMDDHDAIVIIEHSLCGERDDHVILRRHQQAVFIHQLYSVELNPTQRDLSEHHVEDAELIIENS